MKKDIKWLVQSVNTERESLRQRFESREETPDENAFNDGRDWALLLVLRLIDHLDEPEVLSQKWIDEHKESRINNLRKRTTSDVVPVDDLQNLIVTNQEPEVTLDKAFEKISELYPMTKEEIWKHLEQNAAYGGRVTYGEPEVLSQEWIDDKTFVVTDSDGDDYAVVGHASLKNLIIPKQEITEEQVMDWLDKNDFYDHITAETVLERAVDKGELSYYGTKYSVIETPKIPKFVVDFIKDRKHTDAYNLQYIFHTAMEGSESEQLKKEYDWIRQNGETFARAWLDGYTVEEPLYYALIKGHELVNDEVEWATKYWNLWVSEGCMFPYDKSETTDDFSMIMTKSEWGKWGINDSNADFVKVGEIGE